MTTETKLNLHQRLAKVQAVVTYIQKEKKQGMRYSIVSHDVVTAKVRPHMVEHGVLYYPSNIEVTQIGNRTQAVVDVVFANVDDPKDFITVASMGYGIDDQDKGPGKAISYAVKYAVLKVLSLESGDDPDLDQDAVLKDPMKMAIADFESEVALCTTEQTLRDTATKHKDSMDHAAGSYPAEVASAKTQWQKRMKQVKSIIAKVPNGEANGGMDGAGATQ